ncbi:MAG: Uma2 family endonuclease [Chloroflexi bacterium]|nr:Uma2 family endonuclease [Chloroflexota bacterium]
MTAEDLLRLPDDGMRHELIAGELRTMAPTGDEHGGIVVAIAASLGPYVQSHRLGRVRAGEPGYHLASDPDTVRAADVAFISRERLGAAGRLTGYRSGAPDLVVEVISPNDLYTEVDDKVALWLAHGTRMVIVVNPRRRTAAVYRSPTAVRILTETDTLDGDDVVPGWTMPVAALFERDDDLADATADT